MLEIAQHVMSFLHKLDRPAISLHQEMVMRQKEEEREKVKKQQTEREQYRMKYEEEVSYHAVAFLDIDGTHL